MALLFLTKSDEKSIVVKSDFTFAILVHPGVPFTPLG